MKTEELTIYTEEEAEEYLTHQDEDIFNPGEFEREDLEPHQKLIDSTKVSEKMIQKGFQVIMLKKSETNLFVREP